MVRIRRAINDVFISVVALTILLALLASVNERVRYAVGAKLTAGGAQTEMSKAAGSVRNFADDVYDALRDQTIEHAPLVIFVIAGGALTIFMLRV
jgi:hypothetical protein